MKILDDQGRTLTAEDPQTEDSSGCFTVRQKFVLENSTGRLVVCWNVSFGSYIWNPVPASLEMRSNWRFLQTHLQDPHNHLWNRALFDDSPTVEWTRADLKPKAALVYRDNGEVFEMKHQRFEFRTSLFHSEVKDGNVSLRISDVQLSDAGMFHCLKIPMEDARVQMENSTVELVVVVSAVSVSDPKISMVSVVSGNVFVECQANCWRPKPEMKILDDQGRTLIAKETQIKEPSGCFTVRQMVVLQNLTRKGEFTLETGNAQVEVHTIDWSWGSQYFSFCWSDYRPLTIDTNTASRRLQVSEDRRVATFVTDVQPYSDHPDRFDDQWSNQLLCTEVLSGRCYWEVEWRGRVEVAVSYRGIGRRGDKNNCRFGKSRQSWCLICFDWDSYCVRHDNKETLITFTPSSSSSAESHRAAVYVDYRAGSLSFFRVSDSPMHIYTFDTTFTEAPYPGFELREGSSLSLLIKYPLRFGSPVNDKHIKSLFKDAQTHAGRLC
uniref:Selection and upkeep of intraepithelial T-cells protein 1-like n=1 Tax=Oryzias melastigma TaxID=30732 RepID=A0A3B3E1V6_ORYME